MRGRLVTGRLGAAIALMVVTCGSPAPAAVLCKTRASSVTLRDACRRSETKIDPVALGLQGPKGDPGPPGPPGPVQTLDVQTVVNQRSAGPGLAETDAACPAGYTLTGGGAGTGSGSSTLIDSDSCGPLQWCVVYYNPPGGALNIATASCARLK